MNSVIDIIKVGDHVKLTNYSYHSDWIEHDNEVALVVQIEENNLSDGYDYSLVWEDGTASASPRRTLLKVNKDWDL